MSLQIRQKNSSFSVSVNSKFSENIAVVESLSEAMLSFKTFIIVCVLLLIVRTSECLGMCFPPQFDFFAVPPFFVFSSFPQVLQFSSMWTSQ